MQTADRIQNVDQVQNFDCRLQSGYKMQTENLMSFFVWYVITCNLTTYRASRDRFSAISFHDYLHYSGLFLARFLIKLDAYLRSPGLSVWNKLVFCAYNCLSFYTIIGLFWNFFFSWYAIPEESGDNITPMSDQKKTQTRMALSDLKLIIIDEISVVSNTLLLHIHQQLKEILSTSNNCLFAGLSIITVGDLYQLPPIWRKFVFEEYKNNGYNLCHSWLLFKVI